MLCCDGAIVVVFVVVVVVVGRSGFRQIKPGLGCCDGDSIVPMDGTDETKNRTKPTTTRKTTRTIGPNPRHGHQP